MRALKSLTLVSRKRLLIPFDVIECFFEIGISLGWAGLPRSGGSLT